MPQKTEDADKVLVSKQKWIIVGLLIIIFNPLPAGFIYGFALWREKMFKSEGNLMMIFSLLWGGISLALTKKYLGY